MIFYKPATSPHAASKHLCIPVGAASEKDLPFLLGFVRWSWRVLMVCSLLQMVFFWSLANAIAVSCVSFVWLLFTKLFLRKEVLSVYPLSSFLIFGFVITQFYFPLVFTLLESKPIIFNLDLPYQVFLHSVLTFLLLVLVHVLYRAYAKNHLQRHRSLLLRAGFFQTPSSRQLWIMGFLGLSAMFYVHFYSPSVGREVSGAGDKLIQGLITFSYAPFFIPFGRLFGRESVNMKALLPMLLLFTLLLFLVSLGRNSRGAFMLGFTSVGFAFILGLLLGILKTRLFTLRNILLAVFGFWFFTGPLADIATAMVMVRGQRYDITRMELISLTLQAFNDKEAIRLYKLAGISQDREWDEQYMNNLFLARFCNIKYNDASLLDANRISEADPDMFNFTMDRFWATLPQPALTVLNMQVDKAGVTTYSFGDYLHYKAGASSSALGGFRTGHFAGMGMAAFGWWYLLILGIGMWPVYYIFDKLVMPKRTTSQDGKNYHKPLFSFCGLLGLTSIFMFMEAESVIEPYVFLIRGCLQMLLLYFLVYHLSRHISVLLPGMVFIRRVKRRAAPIR